MSPNLGTTFNFFIDSKSNGANPIRHCMIFLIVFPFAALFRINRKLGQSIDIQLSFNKNFPTKNGGQPNFTPCQQTFSFDLIFVPIFPSTPSTFSTNPVGYFELNNTFLVAKSLWIMFSKCKCNIPLAIPNIIL